MPKPAPYNILIDIDRQRLELRENDAVRWQTEVSTAKNGPGQISGSECTPLGRHIIRARIGAGLPAGTVFVGRRPTGEIYTPELRRQYPTRDWILTRILWLSGLEPGFNRLGKVDTMRRYVYIHGCPEDDAMGVPSSHGCIKMRHNDVIYLFDNVSVGTPVNLVAGGS